MKNKNSNDFLTTKDIASATRRFITRYLIGIRKSVEISEVQDFCFQLEREELWDLSIRKNEDLIDLIYKKLVEFKLKVSQAYDFYNIIGDEDKNALNI